MSESDPPSDDFNDEESTDHGVEDVPKPMKAWTRTTSRRIRTVERHFEPKGMVYEVHADWTAVKKSVGVFKWLGPMIGGFVVTIVIAIVWLVQHAATQPAPKEPPRAEDIAREVVKQQQK